MTLLQVRGHLNMAMSVDRTLYFQSDVHGVLGQISPNSATDNGLLPPEMQVALFSLLPSFHRFHTVLVSSKRTKF